jgi:hypothetical protein
MIRRFSLSVLVACVYFSPFVLAADLPSIHDKKFSQHSNATNKPKKHPAKLPLAIAASTQDPSLLTVTKEASLPPGNDKIDMSWVLDPLVANADGGKHEDSASVEGNLVVVEPDFVAASQVTIELSGHIVKTVDTTARIDVVIGTAHRSLTWKVDDVQAGRFNFEFDATLPAGKLPDYIPVSALAFVTREKSAGAVMISLEKVSVRMGRLNLAQAQ